MAIIWLVLYVAVIIVRIVRFKMETIAFTRKI